MTEKKGFHAGWEMEKNMRDYNDLFSLVERVVHKYSQREKLKKTFENEITMTQTEIHILASIGAMPGCGVTELARQKGVTNGAVSQILKKLVEKDLVRKEISPKSEAMVELYLTETGTVCYEEFKRSRNEETKNWCMLLEMLDEDTYQSLKKLLVGMDKIFDANPK